MEHGLDTHLIAVVVGAIFAWSLVSARPRPGEPKSSTSAPYKVSIVKLPTTPLQKKHDLCSSINSRRCKCDAANSFI